MGSMSSYSSPKTSSVSSFSSPKSRAYETSKVSTSVAEPRPVSRSFENNISGESGTNLNDFRCLLTDYLELTEQIEQLQERKRILEEKIANNPEYEKFTNLFNSMKGPKK